MKNRTGTRQAVFTYTSIKYALRRIFLKTFPKPLTPGEEKQYLERCLKGDLEARNILIERNMRLVAHVAKKYQNTDYDMEDLLSVGTIGLIKAVSTFHPDRGSRLATYAAKCIENAILPQMRRETGREYKRARSWRLKQKTAPEECSSGAVFMCFARFRALR